MKLAAIALTSLALHIGALHADEESAKPATTPAATETSKPVAAPAPPMPAPAADGKTSRRSKATPSPLLTARNPEVHAGHVLKLLDQWLADGLVRAQEDSSAQDTPELSLSLNYAWFGSGDRATAALLELSELQIPHVSVDFQDPPHLGRETPEPTGRLQLSAQAPWDPARKIIEVLERHQIPTKAVRSPTITLWVVSNTFSSPDQNVVEELQPVVKELNLKLNTSDLRQLTIDVLFPANAAAIYEPQEAAEVLKWLRVRQLVLETISSSEQWPGWITHSPAAAVQNSGLVKRSSTWTWSASPSYRKSEIDVQRRLSVNEEWRGKPAESDKPIEDATISVSVEPDKVAIVHAFPYIENQGGATPALVQAVQRKDGYLTLLIIENPTLEQPATSSVTDSEAQPKLHVPNAATPVHLRSGPRSGGLSLAEFDSAIRLFDFGKATGESKRNRTTAREADSPNAPAATTAIDPSAPRNVAGASNAAVSTQLIIVGDGNATSDADKEKIKKLISEGVLKQIEPPGFPPPDAAVVMFQPNLDPPAPGTFNPRPELSTTPINPKWDDALRELSKQSVETEIRIRFFDPTNLGWLASFTPNTDVSVIVPVDSTHQLADAIKTAFEKTGLVVDTKQSHPFFGPSFIPKGKELYPVYANEAGSPSSILQSTEDLVDVRLTFEDTSGLRQTFGPSAPLLERAQVHTFQNAPKDAGGRRVVGILVNPDEARLLRAAERVGRLEALRRDPSDKTTHLTADFRERLSKALLAESVEPLSKLAALAASSPSPAAPNVKIVHLQNSHAASMSSLLAQIIRADGFTAVADERTNSVIITSPDVESMTLAESLLAKLDAEPARGTADPFIAHPHAAGPSAKPLAELQKAYAAKEAVAAVAAAELRTKLDPNGAEAENVARYLSNEFFNQAGRDERTFVDELHKATLGRPARPEERSYWIDRFNAHKGDRPRFVREYFAVIHQGSSASTTNKVPPQEAALREKLTAAVKEAFAARQAMLTAELAALEARIAETRRALELRSKIAERIVAQRVEDLLSADFTANEAGSPLPSDAASPFAPAATGGTRRNPLTAAAGRKPRTLAADGLDFGRAQRLIKSLGARSNAQTTAGGVEFQFEATDDEYEKFRTVVEAEAAEARREKEDRDQARRLSLLTGIWDQIDSGQGSGPDAPRLVIHGELASTFQGNQRKRLFSVKSDAEGRYGFSALDGQSSMDGTYDQGFGAGSLRLVSVGQEGAEIVAYTRSIGVVPSEWITEMQQAAPKPATALKPIDELLGTKPRASEVARRKGGGEPPPLDIAAQLTGIWETGFSPGMSGMEGDMGMGMLGGPVVGAPGIMSGSPGPRLVIYGDRAALYEKNEQKRLWTIEIEQSGANSPRVNFLPQDGQAGMQGAYASRDRSLTIVSTGQEGATIVRYHRTVSAVPPEWAKQMQSSKTTPPGPTQRSLPNLWPAGSPEADVLNNLTGLWTSRPQMGMYGEMDAGYGAPLMDPLAAGNPQSTFLAIHAGQAALYEKNQRKQSWSITIEQLDAIQARLNFVPADAQPGMQGSYTLKSGALTVVSAGEEGPTIEHYRRAVPIVPPEWAADIEKSAPKPTQTTSGAVSRSTELLRGITSGTLRARSQPADPDESVPDEFLSQGLTQTRERSPSDYLELLKNYGEATVEYNKLLQSVGEGHPDALKLRREKELDLKAIEVLRQEFQADLEQAERAVKLRNVQLVQAQETWTYLKRQVAKGTAQQTEAERQRLTVLAAEDALRSAEARLKLFESTKNTLFPPEGTIPKSPPPGQVVPDHPTPSTPALPSSPVTPAPAAPPPAETPVPPKPAAEPSTANP